MITHPVQHSPASAPRPTPTDGKPPAIQGTAARAGERVGSRGAGAFLRPRAPSSAHREADRPSVMPLVDRSRSGARQQTQGGEPRAGRRAARASGTMSEMTTDADRRTPASRRAVPVVSGEPTAAKRRTAGGAGARGGTRGDGGGATDRVDGNEKSDPMIPSRPLELGSRFRVGGVGAEGPREREGRNPEFPPIADAPPRTPGQAYETTNHECCWREAQSA